MVTYSLSENKLTESEDDYMAQAYNKNSFDKEAIIERLLQRGTLLTKTDILAVLNGLEEVAADITKEGGTINLPLFHTSFSISGVFNGPLDMFDNNRHKFNINVNKGKIFRDMESEIELEKVGTPPPNNQIVEVKDSVSGKINETLTPNGVVEIFGTNIKISGKDPSCGLSFIPASGTESKVTTLVQNKPSSLIAMVPALPKGKYTVKIVTQYSGGGALVKIPRIVVFDKTLTVV